ncbi:MAG: hypothetical protein LC128_07020 [Chitinophagales bacterium]|nr:hypothetical protein [Chitinophagales bacterium]
MTRLQLLTNILISIIIFSSCSQKDNQIDIDKALSNTASKFPQLPKRQSDYYKLIRSVTIGDNGVELQLRSMPDTLDDPQKIIIVINKAKQLYVIPLFSNTYHDYWNFQFDSVLSSVKPTNTTFEKELKNCLTQLNLYDTLGTAGKVINEMLVSLLQCQQVTDTDSLNLHSVALTNNYNLPYEDSDSCFKRLQENWHEMKKDFYPEDYIINYNTYWDKGNNRVYQFDFKNFSRKQKLEFTIKNYRLDCVYQMLNL